MVRLAKSGEHGASSMPALCIVNPTIREPSAAEDICYARSFASTSYPPLANCGRHLQSGVCGKASRKLSRFRPYPANLFGRCELSDDNKARHCMTGAPLLTTACQRVLQAILYTSGSRRKVLLLTVRSVPMMSPRKLFERRRSHSKGHSKMHAVGGKFQSQAEEEAESRRGSYDSAYPMTSERQVNQLRRSKTAQSEATTQSGRTSSTSSSSFWGRHPLPFPFGRKRSTAPEGDIFGKSQQAATEKAARKEDKAAKKHEEKEKGKKAKQRKQWPEHMEWFFGANLPGYWVI
ncbi:hypothetical protein CERZMDRAFT_83218 [Cercospora zeae-maydis SCOH1-5]|uniref:Uncharacterized protein n=1 Tax=Cercospora zeae-maydis SCOH1-5 TaxID=717836 RepID=A0A6A6FML8_9PEZI|nr:hypothetical protein CERZMDRAFT_83218 [Cercospora zeae-maydis SCOH1-5]